MRVNLDNAEGVFEHERARLLADVPSLVHDSEALADTLDGITDWQDALRELVREAVARESMAEGLKDQIERMTARCRRLLEGSDKLREMVRDSMERMDLRKLAAPDFTASLSPGRPSLVMADDAGDHLPDDLVRVTRKPDAKKVREALAGGRDLAGLASLSNGGPNILTVRTR